MPLDLTEFLPDDEEITSKGKDGEKITVKVSADIPRGLIFEFSDVRNMDEKNFTKKDLDRVTELIKKILLIKNDEALVDKFLDSLSWVPFVRVMTWLFNYIKNVTDEATKAGDKKKD